MYAVIKTGGKQYRVSAGEIVKVEKLPEEVDGKVTFADVMLVGDGDSVEVGRPLLKGRSVEGVVVKQARSAKVRIVKFRRRKHYMKQGNHRQAYTAVKIEAII